MFFIWVNWPFTCNPYLILSIVFPSYCTLLTCVWHLFAWDQLICLIKALCTVWAEVSSSGLHFSLLWKMKENQWKRGSLHLYSTHASSQTHWKPLPLFFISQVCIYYFISSLFMHVWTASTQSSVSLLLDLRLISKFSVFFKNFLFVGVFAVNLVSGLEPVSLLWSCDCPKISSNKTFVMYSGCHQLWKSVLVFPLCVHSYVSPWGENLFLSISGLSW